MFYRMPNFVFYPATVLWSVIFGGLAGACFKLIAVYENWMTINRLQVILWKKYPQRSYRKYITRMWAHHIKGKPVEFAEYARMELEKKHPAEPFPFTRILTNTVFMVFIAPFMALSGLLYGPVHVFSHLRTGRMQYQSLQQ